MTHLDSSQLVEMESQRWINSQYFGKEPFEVVELAKSLSNNQADGRVCDIFGKLGCNITRYDLDACHWLKDKERVIVKFFEREDFEQVLSVNNDLKNLKLSLVNKQEAALQRQNRWLVFFNGSVKTKRQENNPPSYTSHIHDFKKYFPHIEL